MVGVKGVNRVSYSIGPDLFHKLRDTCLHLRHLPPRSIYSMYS